MSAILAGFGINTSGSPRRLAQRDTEAYWRRLLALGGTDINANDEVENVQEFLAGVYGLTSDLVACWSLRSSQSMGTGAIVAPFGGRMQTNGTLVNGPVWGADGLFFAASPSQNLNTAYSMSSGTHTIFAVARNPSVGVGSQTIFRQTSGSNTVHTWIRRAAATALNLANEVGLTAAPARINAGANTSAALPLNAFFSLVAGTDVTHADGQLIVTYPNNSWDEKIAFFLVTNDLLSIANRDALHDLYKSTLGQGLGLP